MPRQHLGNNDRRAGHSSRSRSRSSSSSVRNNKTDDNIDFEYDEFDDNNKKKKSTNNTAAYRRKSTHSSPTITVSDLAKKKKKSTTNSNNNNQRRRSSSSNNNKPVGKPVNNTKAKTIKKSNNENVVNSNNKRKKGDGGKGKQQQGGKKKQQVSFSVDSDNSDEDVYTSNTKKKSKRVNNMKSNNIKYDDSCLFDTDEESSSENYDDVMIVEEKKKGSTTKKNTKNKSITTQNNSNTNNNTQVLPQQVLAVDNRVMPTPTADSMARVSFLNCIPQLVEGGVQKGVLNSNSTIMASLVHGSTSSQLETSKGLRKSKGVGTLVQSSVVPRASYLFESYSNEEKNDSSSNRTALSKDEQSLWLTDFVSPINSGLAGAGDNHRMNGSGSIKSTEGFTASDGWNCFGDLGKLYTLLLLCLAYHLLLSSTQCMKMSIFHNTSGNN